MTDVLATRIGLGTLVLGLMLFVAACSGKRPAAEAPEEAMVPDDFYLILGTSGMASGGMQGWSVRADGSVLRWSGKAPEAEVQATGTLPAEQVAALWAAVQEAGVMDMQQQAMATRTAFINVTAGGASRRVTWERPLGELDAENPLEQLYADLQKAAASALQAGE